MPIINNNMQNLENFVFFVISFYYQITGRLYYEKKFISIFLVLVFVPGLAANCYAATDFYPLDDTEYKIAWVRDLNQSPLAFMETLIGNYTLEVDYLGCGQHFRQNPRLG